MLNFIIITNLNIDIYIYIYIYRCITLYFQNDAMILRVFLIRNHFQQLIENFIHEDYIHTCDPEFFAIETDSGLCTIIK